MSNSYRALALFFIILFTTGGIHAQTKSQQIDSLLHIAHQRGFFNGNALVAEKEKVIYQNGIGYADAKRKMLTPDLRFRIGSISKEFDGTAIMILKEKNKLSMGNRLSDFYPDLPNWARKISVQNLLQYTSGLPSQDYQTVRTDAQVWNYLYQLKNLEFEPGSDYRYNNVDVFLRKRVVEKASGQPYTDFITENVLKPCGMANAVIDPTEETPEMARSFDNHFVQDDLDTYMSGWVSMTAEDLYKWTKCLHSEKLISKTGLYELFESFKPSSQSPLGHSIYENNELKYQYHHGQSDNFEAAMYYNPQDEFTVILLTNNRNSNVGDLTSAIDAILRGETFEIPKKSIEMMLRTEIFYNGFEKGIQVYKSISKYERSIYDFKHEEHELIETGEYLLEKDRLADGLKMLKFTVAEFPESPKAYAVLGEAYQMQGNLELALQNFEKSLELNPDNQEVRELVQKLAN